MTTQHGGEAPKTLYVPEGKVLESNRDNQESEPAWLKPDWTGSSGVFAPPRDDADPYAKQNVTFREGMVIGQYELIRQLGRGGMGVVYLARDNRLGRRVAIKFLQFDHPEFTRRFIVEARATARCTHENIVVIHEVGEHAGSPFMVLEYIEGHPLSELRASAPLPLTRVVEIMTSVVRALARAHDEGIVHRDLKPENVLLGSSGTIKVLDFGIAKLLKENSAANATAPASLRRPATPESFAPGAQKSGLVGTMAYMSPEQWVAGGTIDHRTDIWTVGIMLYELLSGINPLERLGTKLPGWIRQFDASIPSLSGPAPSLPKEMVQLVDRCLRKNLDERFSSARDLLRALEPFLPGRYQGSTAQLETGPYAGLRAFQEEDAGRFFGRTTELAEMLTRIVETPLMAVVGPSGVGKSSFLRAGVVPTLRSRNERWFIATIRPGRSPMSALAAICLPMLDASELAEENGSKELALRSRLILEPGYFGKVLRDYCQRTRQKAFLLVDQFEELYVLGTHVLERAAFTACLAGAADDRAAPIRVVLTLRADFLGRIAEDARFLNIVRSGLFFLGPPSSDGLRQALLQPAELVGYRFENTVIVNEMVHFLESTPNGLPLLQFAASQLWEHRDPLRRLLTEQSYRGLGGVAGALVSHADRIVARLSVGRQALCRNLFIHLVTPEGTRAVRKTEELIDLIGEPDELKTLISELVDERLLVVQTTNDGSGVELVHESLIINWPTLRGWLDSSHEDSRFIDQLLAAAHQWDVNRRGTGLLWSGEMIDELKRFERRYQGKLPVVATEFVTEIHRQARRRARFRRGLTVAGLLAALAVFAAGAVALVLINNAKSEAEHNALTAKAAEVEAQKRLQERILAEESRKRAEEKSGQLEGRVRLNAVELAAKNHELMEALGQAQMQRALAERSQRAAEENARIAKDATGKAERANQELHTLFERERERANRLDEQLGRLVEELH